MPVKAAELAKAVLSFWVYSKVSRGSSSLNLGLILKLDIGVKNANEFKQFAFKY